MGFYNTYAEGRVFDPYDCSKQPSSQSGGNLTKYCLQSRFYSCATKVHCPINELGASAPCAPAEQQKLSAFFPCAESAGGGGMSSFSDAMPCAKNAGLDIDAISKCYDPSKTGYDSEPVQVIDAIANATAAAKPKVQYFPDVRVNGKQLQQATAKALVKAICQAYKGAKPSGCN